MHYIYCPKCGNLLIEKEAGDEGKVPYCEKCSKFWFDTFSSCSIVLVANEFDEVALLKQSYLSDKYATFVSGYIIPGESAVETGIREVKEEIGIDLERLENSGTCWFAQGDMLMHSFVGFTNKGEFKLSQEVDEARWVPALDVPKFLFPDSPGNAAYVAYRYFLKVRGIQNKI